MRQSHRTFDDAAPENFGCNFLLTWKAIIEAVDQDVRINEGGYGYTGRLWSNLCRDGAVSYAPSPGRI